MFSSKIESRLCSGSDFMSIFMSSHANSNSVVFSFLNPYSYGVISNNDHLIDGVDYWFSDGALLCGLTNIFRSTSIVRASFDLSSIGRDVLMFASDNCRRVFFVGGSEREIGLAVNNISNEFPGLLVVGHIDGYFDKSKSDAVIELISSGRPDILIVGMGTPYQEIFSILCKEKLSKPCLIFTCGGFLTQASITVDYYDSAIKFLGLRWLQRAYDFPHVRRRLLNDYPIFIIKYISSIIASRFRRL